MDNREKEIRDWFNKNYQWLLDNVKKNIAKGGMSEYASDLLSTAIEWFLTRPIEQQYQMYQDGLINNYLWRICSIQLKSQTSPFYNNFRKFKMSARSGVLPEIEVGDVSIEGSELYECFQQTHSTLNFYQQKLIEENYYNGLSYSEISKKYGFSLASLQKEFKIIYKVFRDKCDHCSSTKPSFENKPLL
jgi:hypothetical protein